MFSRCWYAEIFQQCSWILMKPRTAAMMHDVTRRVCPDGYAGLIMPCFLKDLVASSDLVLDLVPRRRVVEASMRLKNFSLRLKIAQPVSFKRRHTNTTMPAHTAVHPYTHAQFICSLTPSVAYLPCHRLTRSIAFADPEKPKTAEVACYRVPSS